MDVLYVNKHWLNVESYILPELGSVSEDEATLKYCATGAGPDLLISHGKRWTMAGTVASDVVILIGALYRSLLIASITTRQLIC